MLIEGIINPQLLSLIARVRHTNTLVIADAAFPFWPMIETVDLTLVRGIPTIPQVLDCLLPNWKCGGIWMAEELNQSNPPKILEDFEKPALSLDIVKNNQPGKRKKRSTTLDEKEIQFTCVFFPPF